MVALVLILSMKQIGAPSSGSLRGDTFSRNRYGPYIRNRSIPVNPNTPSQSAARQTFSDQSQAWAGVTSTAKQNWRDYAALHPRVNAFGEEIILSGASQFVSTNALRVAAGLATSNNVPGEPEFVNPAATTISPSFTTVGSVRAIDVVGLDQPTGYVAIVKASPWMGLGRVTPLRMTQVAVIDATAWSAGEDIAAGYAAVFGSFPAGSRIVFDVRILSDTGAFTPQLRLVENVVTV
jgi:hypothetical protein